MAQIVVESGSYWAAGKLLRPGRYVVPDDSPLIAAVLECEMPTVYVIDTMVPAVAPAGPPLDEGAQLQMDAQTPQPEEKPVEVVEVIEPADGTGTMKSSDLTITKTTSHSVACPMCPEREDFTNRGALSSHVRAKHPELDPATLQPRETVPAPMPSPVDPVSVVEQPQPVAEQPLPPPPPPVQ